MTFTVEDDQLLQERLSKTPSTLHVHKWSVVIEEGWLTEFPCDVVRSVVAVCACGARLTREAIERILDEQA